MDKSEFKVERTKGTGPGGQNKNKRETACRLTHIPTGIQAYADTRTWESSYKMALKELEKRVEDAKAEKKAAEKKARRDEAIHDHTIVRTYSFTRGIVKDHRTGKEASVKSILEKGDLDKLK